MLTKGNIKLRKLYFGLVFDMKNWRIFFFHAEKKALIRKQELEDGIKIISGMKSPRKERRAWIEKPSLDGRKWYPGSEQLGDEERSSSWRCHLIITPSFIY